MAAKQVRQVQGSSEKKVRKHGKKVKSINPDEMISEINQQSTALQKIVSRFLDPVADDNSAIRQKQKE